MSFQPINYLDPIIAKTQRKIKDQLKLGSGLRFPDNIGSSENPKAMKFNFYEYVKPDRETFEKAEPISSVTLLLPPQLIQSSGLSYTQFDGSLEYGAVEAATAAFRNKEEIRDFFGSDVSAWEKIKASGSQAAIGGNAMASKALRTISENAANIADVLTGRTLNPRQLSKFERVNFRTYQFSWLMVAKNSSEAEQIKNITQEFKKNAHPAKSEGGAFFEFPSLVDFEYLPSELNEWLWRPQPCAITNISIDYNVAGTPKFHKDDGSPVEIMMNVQLSEMLINTREDIEKGF